MGISQSHFFHIPPVPDDHLERTHMESGYRIIAGVDEAGRGPLAGPVVAAAVILLWPNNITGLNDSKKLTPKERENLYEVIFKNSISVGVGIASNQEIDEFDILRATLQAMKEAVENLTPRPDLLLIDGMQKIPLSVSQKAIKKGDQQSVSIAAASIIAKVSRDRMMELLHRKYPGYNFAKNKGYGTREHLTALTELGISPVHRKTFRPVREKICEG